MGQGGYYYITDAGSQFCLDFELKACFEPCSETIKRRLRAFMDNPRAWKRTFTFGAKKVTIVKAGK